MIRKRWKYEEVKEYFQNQNCKLLECDYINSKTIMNYLCVCGEISKISFENFKNGQRCKRCGFEKTANARRMSIEEVKIFFEKSGCVLLESEYKNAETKMRYICSCGNESEITYAAFYSGNRCMLCGAEKRAKKRRIPYEEVKHVFESEGCILLDENYKNNNQSLNYICSCGRKSSVSLAGFKSGKRCKQCGYAKNSERFRFSYEEVRIILKTEGCVLLEKNYKNAHQLLDYICSCGRQSCVSLCSFKNGVRCSVCWLDRISRENSYLWKGGLTSVGQYLRDSSKIWKINSMISCDHQCVITGDSVNLEIHHTYPFNKILKETFDKLTLPIYLSVGEYTKEEMELIKVSFLAINDSYGLGVVLRKDIHAIFHSLYGSFNFSAKDFDDFKQKVANSD